MSPLVRLAAFCLLVLLMGCKPPTEASICKRDGPNPAPCNHPVVLVPGLAASVLEILYEPDYEPLHEICTPGQYNVWSEPPFRLWPALQVVFPTHFPELGELRECRLDDMRVRFDPETRRFSNAPGVRIRPRDFGCVDGITNLFQVKMDDRVLVSPSASAVYEALVDTLIQDHGYTNGRNLAGAPYDFRRVGDPVETRAYYGRLKALIEELYESTRSCESGPKRVFVATHSLGGPVALHFFNTYVDAAWKQKYIQAYLPIASPFGGSPKAYRTLLSGDSEGLPGDNVEFLDAERMMGGLLWMAPAGRLYPGQDFVTVAGEGYGATEEDYRKVFGEIAGQPDQALMLSDVFEHRYDRERDPDVLTGCFYGNVGNTEAHYRYEGADFSKDPEITGYAPGDGTVLLDSLEICKRFERVHARAFEGPDFEHQAIVMQPEFVEHATMLITNCWSDARSGPRDPRCPEVGPEGPGSP